jgi:hypothetical protein
MDVRLHEHELGLSWTVADEVLQRTSHALVAGGSAWLVDPFDDAGALERVAQRAPVAGVLQLLDRHPRGGRAIADRLGVPFLRLPRDVPGTPFELFDVVSVPRWRERGLWWEERRALVVPEAVGSVPYFTTGTGELGVHPFLRLVPPKVLRRFATAEHVLVGHGAPVHGGGAAPALGRALDRSRRDLPRVPLAVLRARP